jgi:hypothetical protein
MQIAADDGMTQIDLGLDLSKRRTRRQTMLDEVEQSMPWGELLVASTRNTNAFAQKSAIKQPISPCEKICLAHMA